MAEESFRLPKSSYGELVKIIQAYGNSASEATLDAVAQAGAMDRTIISRNNAFLASVGIIEGGKAKGITEKGRKLSNALQFQMTEEIASLWREVIAGSDFLQKMVTAVSIRQGMEDSALQAHIAYSAGESKSPMVMAGAGAVVEILMVARLIKEQEGKLVAETDALQQGMSSVGILAREPTAAGRPERTVSDVAGTREAVVPTGVPGISIQIQIQCSGSEISDLAPKLRALLRELSRKDELETDEGRS